MKKSLIAFLLSLSCIGAMALAGCGEDNTTSSSSSSVESSTSEDLSSPDESGSTDDSSSEDEGSGDEILPGTPVELDLTFEEGEGFTYENVVTVELDGVYSVGFTVELGGFYQDSVPLVYVDDVLVSPINAAGMTVYSSIVQENSVIRVENVKRDVSNMQGDGTFENAFVVSKPIDLLYIAEQVNKGVARYVQGAYILGNDIDCKGAELKVIGDLSTENSYFSGCFSCYTNPETGEMERYTISNFTINSQNANYVGLFGAVQSDYNVTSSALFYGIRLDNFTIEANLYNLTSASKTLAVGSLIGYGAGANMYLCEATNGTINLSGDNNYFSFAGGLIGYQQAFLSNMGQYCASEIAYATVDVDVNIVSGMTLYAGGIVGYMNTTYPLVSVASVHNSYATGDVAGALRAGGIVGGLGQFSVVNNSYAANDVSAICYQNKADGMASSDEYYYANAGGLVGFAENDSIVHDCFHIGSVDAYAMSGESYAVTDPLVGGGYEKNDVSPVSEKYIALDCLSNIDLKEIDSNGGILKEKLGWEAYDWIFTKNDLPVINFEASEGTITRALTLEYVTKTADGTIENVKINGQTSLTRDYLDTSNSSANAYVTMGSFFAGGGLAYYYTADNGYVSYGYYFDKECTIPVPYAYMPTKNVTLYIGFYDLSDIAGDYYLISDNNEVIKINLGKDGYVTYPDGASEHKTNYTYNGETLVLESVRLARYYDGDIVIDTMDEYTYADPNFDLYRYTYYNFVGTYENGEISLYDGTYFTKDAPLVASPTVPDSLKYDAFKGEWAKSANVRKVYSFDGQGKWTYNYDGVEEGNYTVSEDGATITFTHDGVEYTGSFNKDGLLEIVSDNGVQVFNRNYGYLGLWTGTDNYYGDFVLDLAGIGKDGKGVATLTYENGLVYELVYEASETDGYVALYQYSETDWKADIFGYFSYNRSNHTLNSVLYDTASTSYYTAFTLRAIDDYEGEWICNADDLLNVEFNFDGIGLYASLGTNGSLVINENGVETVVPYTLDKFLKGTFTYNGTEYSIAYNEDDKTVTIAYANSSALLERKDVFANETFIDADGNVYVFDGRSNLSSGGKLTVNGESEYLYRKNGESFLVYEGATEIGAIALNENHYDLTLNGDLKELYIQNELMGEWAMRGQYDVFTVSYEDTDGYIYAKFRGYDVKMSYYDTNILTFSYKEGGKMPYTYYVFIYEDGAAQDTYLFITEYADLTGDDVIYCSRASDMYDTWKWNKDPSMAITFDGIAYSYLTAYSGIAKQTRGGYSTDYYYYILNGEMIMYSQTTLQGKTWYYHVELLKKGDEGYAAALTDINGWVSENGTVIVRTEVDSLFAGKATDENENEYFFDHVTVDGETLGAICLNGEIKYTYVMDDVAFNSANSTAEIQATDVATGKVYRLVLDYSNENGNGDILTIGEEITDEVTE